MAASGGEIGVAQDLWEWAKAAGPFGTLLMGYMWLRGDKERRQALLDLALLHVSYQTRIEKLYDGRLLQAAESGKALAEADAAMDSVANATNKMATTIEGLGAEIKSLVGRQK